MTSFVLYFLLGLLALGCLVAALVFLYPVRPARPRRGSAPADPSASTPPAPEPTAVAPPAPKVEATGKMIMRTHSLSVKRANETVEFSVDGTTYHHMAEIPDPNARQTAKDILLKMLELPPAAALSATAHMECLTVAVQETNGQKRYVVNGVSYAGLEEIPDATLRERVRQLIGLNQLVPSREKILIEFINGKARFTIDGTPYSSLQAIPDTETRRCAEEAFLKLWEAQAEAGEATEPE